MMRTLQSLARHSLRVMSSSATRSCRAVHAWSACVCLLVGSRLGIGAFSPRCCCDGPQRAPMLRSKAAAAAARPRSTAPSGTADAWTDATSVAAAPRTCAPQARAAT